MQISTNFIPSVIRLSIQPILLGIKISIHASDVVILHIYSVIQNKTMNLISGPNIFNVCIDLVPSFLPANILDML